MDENLSGLTIVPDKREKGQKGIEMQNYIRSCYQATYVMSRDAEKQQQQQKNVFFFSGFPTRPETKWSVKSQKKTCSLISDIRRRGNLCVKQKQRR